MPLRETYNSYCSVLCCPRIVAFFQPCSFGLAISVFACRVLFVLIYSVPARTIHPRFVLAHSVQHYSVRSLSLLQIQFSYQFLLRSFLSSIFPQSQSLSLSASLTIFPVHYKPRGLSIYVFQFSLCHKATKFDFFRSVQASRFPLFYFLFCPYFTASSVRFCRLVYAFQCLFPYYSCRHGLTPAPYWYRFRIVANAYGNSWAGRCIVF